jgi:hypothetical protein
MKLKELRPILCSRMYSLQYAIVYDSKAHADVEYGTIEFVIELYGECEVKHIEAFESQLLITI